MKNKPKRITAALLAALTLCIPLMPVSAAGAPSVKEEVIYANLLAARERLLADGIACDTLKLTQIFPVSDELVALAKQYRRVVFFEEAAKNGGISAIFGGLLLDAGFAGRYARVAVDGFVKQAAVKSCLEKTGLSAEKMWEFVRGLDT